MVNVLKRYELCRKLSPPHRLTGFLTMTIVSEVSASATTTVVTENGMVI